MGYRFRRSEQSIFSMAVAGDEAGDGFSSRRTARSYACRGAAATWIGRAEHERLDTGPLPMSKGRAPIAPAMALILPMMVVSRARPGGVGPAVGLCAFRSIRPKDDTERKGAAGRPVGTLLRIL